MGELSAEQVRILRERAESVSERWQYIKSRCRQQEGRVSNIEKHSPCLAAALNQMEVYLRLLENELQQEKPAGG